MAEWRVEQLGDIVSFEYGSALRAESRTGDGFKVYGSNGVVGYHSSALVAGPGIIIGRKGSVGALHWSEDDFWPIDTTYWAKPKADLDLRWIREALGLAGLESLDSSTGVPGLNRYDAYERRVPVPPLEEQRRITEILDTVDETIQATEHVIAKRQRLRAGLTASLLSGRSEGVPTEDWRTTAAVNDVGLTPVPFAEVADFINGYAFRPADWGRSGLPIVRIQQLLNPDAVADYFSGSLDSRYWIDTGDLVMSWSGTIAVVEWDRGPAWLNQHLFRVDAKAGVEAGFLKHLLDSRLGHLEAASHGTTMKHIKRDDLLKHEVSLPPLEEQRRIARILDKVDETIRRNERKRDKLRHLRSGLAADLLSGRVRTVAV